MILILKIKNALAHRKSFQVKNWGHYFVDSCQAQAELAESLGVNPTTVSKRLKALKRIQKQGYWMPYKLKPRDVERPLVTLEQPLQRLKRKVFLHRTVTGDKKWIHYKNPKPSHALKSAAKPSIPGSKLLLCI